MKNPFKAVAIFSLLAWSAGCVSAILGIQADETLPKWHLVFKDFTSFPLGVGYDPGSAITVENGKISLVASREWLGKKGFESSLSTPVSQPQTEVNIVDNLSNEIEREARLAGIGAASLSEFKRAFSATLKMQSVNEYHIEEGILAVKEWLYDLDVEDNEEDRKIAQLIVDSYKDEMTIITSVIKCDKAEYKYYLDRSFSSKINASVPLQKFIGGLYRGVEIKAEHQSTEILVVEKPVLVGYQTASINLNFLKSKLRCKSLTFGFASSIRPIRLGKIEYDLGTRHKQYQALTFAKRNDGDSDWKLLKVQSLDPQSHSIDAGIDLEDECQSKMVKVMLLKTDFIHTFCDNISTCTPELIPKKLIVSQAEKSIGCPLEDVELEKIKKRIVKIIRREQRRHVRSSVNEYNCFTDDDLYAFEKRSITAKIAAKIRTNSNILDIVETLRKMPPWQVDEILEEAADTYQQTWAEIGRIVANKGQTEAGQRAQISIAQTITNAIKELLRFTRSGSAPIPSS